MISWRSSSKRQQFDLISSYFKSIYWKMDLVTATLVIKRLLSQGIPYLEISQNLGISLGDLKRFINNGHLKDSKILSNLPIYLREINGYPAFTTKQMQDFWDFIFVCTFCQVPDSSGKCRNKLRNPIAEGTLLTLAMTYNRTDLLLFEDIYRWLIRKFASHILGKHGYKIDPQRFSRLICRGQKYYTKQMQSTPRRAKFNFHKLMPQANFQLVFLKFCQPGQVPVWLWETKAFPDLKFVT